MSGIEFRKREIINKPYEAVLRLLVDIVMIICAAYLLVLAYLDSIRITGYSMNDTLKDGDTVLIDKVAFNLRKPSRYDLVIFEPKVANVSQYYIKRVVGLPGETVQIKDGAVYINGNKLEDDVIDTPIYNAGIAAEPVKLGEEQYFVLGDNRNNSDDSRFSNVGFVSEASIIGKPWFVVYPFSELGIPKVTKAAEPAEETAAGK